MNKYSDPEWVQEKMYGEEPLVIRTCNFCSLQSPNLIKIEHEDNSFYSCAESYNSWLSDLYYPESPPMELIQPESYPCYQSLEEPF